MSESKGPTPRKGSKPPYGKGKGGGKNDRGRPPRPPRKPDPRKAAADVLNSIEEEGLFLDTAIANWRSWPRLSERDKALARQLIMVVLRRRGQLDMVLNAHLSRDPHAYVRQVLRLGAAQILFMRTPPHAAVSESVAQVKRERRYENYTGLVNAVLRKVSDKGAAVIASRPPESNLPDWARKRWDKTYGKAEMRALARQLTEVPPLDISVKSDPDSWAEKLGGEVLPTGSVRLFKAGNPVHLDGFDSGEWWIQDIASTLPVKSLAATVGSLDGLRIADICAAPGGKTMQLAAMGAKVTAVDNSKARLSRLHNNLRRTKLDVDIIQADAREWTTTEKFDHILLDAPCSATGTFRRHPDVLWHKTEGQIAELTQIQAAITKQALTYLKPGGTLVFCTCSLEPEEGEGFISRFMSENETLTHTPIDPGFLGESLKTASIDGNIRAMPHLLREKGGMDGFFVAHLKS